MVFGTGTAILSSVIPPQERGRAFGINIGSVYLGLTLGPFLGGLLTHQAGWRSIFLLMLPLGILAITLILTKLKGEWEESNGEKFDLKGSVLYGVSIVSIMYGLPIVTTRLGVILLVSGLALIAVFVWWEYRITNPVLNMNLFLQNRVFAFSNLAALINYSSTFAITFLLSLYLQYIKGYTAQTAGTVLIASPIIMTIVSPIAGRLADKMEPRILSSIGMTLTGIGLMLLFSLGKDTPIAFITGCLIVLGTGFGLFSSPNVNCIMNSVEKSYYGVASATMSTMRLTGQMFSMGLASLIISIFVGHLKIGPENFEDFIHSIRVTFIIFASMNFIGIFASLTRGRVK
jgi:MFS family permease